MCMVWRPRSSRAFRSERRRNAMRRGLILVPLLAFVVTTRSAAGQGAVLVSNGIEALSRRDLRSAIRWFDRAAADSSGNVASSAERWLAHLSWKVRGDAASAANHLDRALKAGGDT